MLKNRRKDNDASLLSRVTVASPCPANWNDMVGDERERFCGQCSLNVYNISTMSTQEAEEFLALRTEGRSCVRFYERKDGTILTDDCPKGLRAIRNASLKVASAVNLCIAFLLGMPAASWAQVPNSTSGGMKVRMPHNAYESGQQDERPVIKDFREAPAGPIPSEAPCESIPKAVQNDALAGFKKKVDDLAKAKKVDSLALARARLDLASCYRSKKLLSESACEYGKAIELLKTMPNKKTMHTNATLNQEAVLKEMNKTEQGNPGQKEKL